jgi:hypothetical protein
MRGISQVAQGNTPRECIAPFLGLALLVYPLTGKTNLFWGTPIVSDGRKVKMATVVPDSRSVILRSTHILLIRIESSEAGPWQPEPNGNLVRHVRLAVHLEQILKGDVAQKEGSHLRFEVQQLGRPGTRYYALSGAWTDQPIQPATRLVAFSSSQSADAANLLVEPSCKEIIPAETSLVDARIALDTERKNLPLSDSLRLAEPSAESLSYVFPEYVAAKFQGSLLGSISEFSSLMRFIENPKLSSVARTTLLDFAVSEIGDIRSPSPPVVLRLVVTLFNLIAMPEATALHDNIVGVYLPEVLRWNRGEGKLSASQVFLGAPSERVRAEAIINGYHGNAATETLRVWLKR